MSKIEAKFDQNLITTFLIHSKMDFNLKEYVNLIIVVCIASLILSNKPYLFLNRRPKLEKALPFETLINFGVPNLTTSFERFLNSITNMFVIS